MRTWLAVADCRGFRGPLLKALRPARVANRGAKQPRRIKPSAWQSGTGVLTSASTNWSSACWPNPWPAAECAPAPRRRRPRRDRSSIAAGAEVIEIDAYRLSLPDDRTPAQDLIKAACAGELVAITFVIAPAVHNLFVLAAEIGLDAAVRRVLNGTVVAACVGPVCAEGALDEGVLRAACALAPRLVPMIQDLTDRLHKARSA